MLNVIVIAGLVLNLAAGFLFIAWVEPIVWGKHSPLFRDWKPENVPLLQWDHAELYRMSSSGEDCS